ncbi:unnamed protein product [Calypogeia fissa]
MEKGRGCSLLAFALFLAFAITGPGLSVHARKTAPDLSILYDSNDAVDRPMNLSGNSVGQYFEVAVDGNNDAVDRPMNLSGNSVGQYFEVAVDGNNDAVDRPMNLSGNSVGQYFEVAVDENKSAATGSEEGWDGKIEYLPGFDTVNGLGVDVLVQCYSQNIANPMLVNELIAPGERQTWAVSVIDPKGPHEKYVCLWTVPSNPYMIVSRTVWTNAIHEDEMPYPCVDCIWKVDWNGLYLWSITSKSYVKEADWH